MGKFSNLLGAICLAGLLPLQGQTVAAKPEAVEPNQIESLIETAKTCLGVPYRSGGTSIKGFDCSGFVKFVFDSVGIELNRSSRTQAKEGTPVALDALLPGDLLFFKTMGRRHAISHVGIYLGDGQFIHAGSWGGPRNRCIRLAELTSRYFAERVVAARRVVAPLGMAEETR
jgi:cell wall-associated NlpC family hydrolase